jgi:hypothetical protein
MRPLDQPGVAGVRHIGDLAHVEALQHLENGVGPAS